MAEEQSPNPSTPWASMPQRKPVPSAPTVTPDTEAATETEHPPLTHTSLEEQKSPYKQSFFTSITSWWAIQKRPRKILIIGLVAGLFLIALIIGLAVGLTVGKKNSKSNLALPTSNGGPYSGDLTYYAPALGSCGYTNTESEHVLAVSHILFDAASTGSNPNDNPLCGLKIRIRRDGESVDAKVVDRCVGCAETDLDVTESVFEKLATLAQGRVTMEWAWLEKAPVNASSQRRDTNIALVGNYVDLHV
ncbi:hypothetical protein N7478_001038 [Penicillium angulare]|uniref:uncharacterized protein n=1 Tax=Penicillium angulare TaxID=116970 RepID=UPI00254032CA|nr:uncharacterized protein N7478_001038 [Penicillium angulare]KAJ5291787.1 hypothetical protein N7478_001038 [Penicillium angulare]